MISQTINYNKQDKTKVIEILKLKMSLEELKKKYFEYLSLNYVKSLQDPEDEPYKSKYEARALLESLLPQIESEPYSTNSDIKQDSDLHRIYTSCLAKFKNLAPNAHIGLMRKFFEYNLSRNYIETEEIEKGEKVLTRIADELVRLDSSKDGYEYNPITAALELSCLNELIFVWSTRGDYKRCLTLIQTVEEIYQAYKKGRLL